MLRSGLMSTAATRGCRAAVGATPRTGLSPSWRASLANQSLACVVAGTAAGSVEEEKAVGSTSAGIEPGRAARLVPSRSVDSNEACAAAPSVRSVAASAATRAARTWKPTEGVSTASRMPSSAQTATSSTRVKARGRSMGGIDDLVEGLEE